MPTGFDVRRLGPGDAPALVTLRRAALEAHPLAFGASPEDDPGRSVELARGALARHDREAIFGLFVDAALAGMVGIYRDSAVKARHKAHLWGMYVAADARRRGAGRALLEAAVGQARAWPGIEQVLLGVTEAAPAARRLYEAVGFREWGREPRALRWQGRTVDEFHLVLDLPAGA
jgi:ribosomal protein S18 acetylase RimI-like enzyme